MAASYYASQKPLRETPVLTPAGALTPEYEAFFAAYQAHLRQDWWDDGTWTDTAVYAVLRDEWPTAG